jgi:tripartite-type tricarboxylate transporter receptor subunit TctC
MRGALTKLLAATIVLLLAAPAAAQWPDKPVRMIVPFAPGGTTDVLARIMAEGYAQAFRQPFLIENRAGAGGNLGAAEAAKAAPDGYTIMMGTPGTQAINQHIYPAMPYNTDRDFAPIVLVARVPNVLVVHPSLGVKTLKELIAKLRAAPGSVNYATPGSGSTGHLSTELFKVRTKTFVVHIPYRGSAPALADLLAGSVQMSIDNLPPYLPHIRSGKLIALGVSTEKSVAALPDVPPIASQVPGYEASSWFALVAPVKTPDAVLSRLNAEANRMLQQPAMRERFAGLGAEAVGGSADQLAKYIASENAKWKEVVKVSGAKPD